MLKNSNAFLKTTLCAVIFLTSNVSFSGGLELQAPSVFVPHDLGNVSLFHDAEGFHAIKNGRAYDVQKCFTDKQVRNVSSEQLRGFLKQGYIAVNQMSDGEFSLQAHGRLVGGGPVAGVIAYWVTKVACYGTASAAVGAAVVATGGAVGIAAGAAGTVVGGAVAVGAGAATVGGVSAGVAAGVLAGGLANAGLVGEAALLTSGAITGAGSVAAATAAVETASLATGAFFTMIPFLP
jgi:hypothetical protein